LLFFSANNLNFS